MELSHCASCRVKAVLSNSLIRFNMAEWITCGGVPPRLGAWRVNLVYDRSLSRLSQVGTSMKRVMELPRPLPQAGRDGLGM